MTDNFLVVLNNDELSEVDGGLIIPSLAPASTVAYAVDMYEYYRESKYVTSFNETVVEAGHYDLVKPSPTRPEYNPLYILTR